MSDACVSYVNGQFDQKYTRSVSAYDTLEQLQAEYWIMTITDVKTNEILIDSIPLLAGEYPAANLLEQYSYLGIGSAVIVKVDPDITEDNPTRDTLGTGFKLVWSDNLE